MIDTPEFTIKNYLSQVADAPKPVDQSISKRMCILLTTSFDGGSCDEPAEETNLCEVETSMTFSKHDLDWAYRQVTQSMH